MNLLLEKRQRGRASPLPHQDEFISPSRQKNPHPEPEAELPKSFTFVLLYLLGSKSSLFPCALAWSPDAERTLTLKRIRLLFCALFLGQLLTPLLDFLIPVDDVLLEGKGTKPAVLHATRRDDGVAQKGNELSREKPQGRARSVN